MDNYQRLCLIAPDRWTSSIAKGLQRVTAAQNRICIVGDESGSVIASFGSAARSAKSVAEGVQGCDLILMGSKDIGAGLTLQNVFSACDRNATVVSHRRSISAVSETLRKLNRDDLHYIGAGLQSSLSDAPDKRSGDSADLTSQIIALCPTTMNDLDVFFKLQGMLQSTGARVIGISPKAHDRGMAIGLELPRLTLVPLLRCLAHSQQHDGYVPMPEVSTVLAPLFALTPDEADAWAAELNDNREHVLSAINEYKTYLAELEKQVNEGHLQAYLTVALTQLSDLSGAEQSGAEITTEPARAREPEVSPPSLDALVKDVNTLLEAVDHYRDSESEPASAPRINAVRKLIENTQAALQHLHAANPEILVAEMEIGSPVEQTGTESESLSGYEDEPPGLPDFEPGSTSGGESSDRDEFVTLAEPLTSTETPVLEEEARDVVVPTPLWESPTLESSPYVSAEPSSGVSTSTPRESFPPQTSRPESPFAEVIAQRGQFDMFVCDKPELQRLSRIKDLMKRAHIPARNIAQFIGPDGRRMIGISLAVPAQFSAARGLLTEAGMQPE